VRKRVKEPGVQWEERLSGRTDVLTGTCLSGVFVRTPWSVKSRHLLLTRSRLVRSALVNVRLLFSTAVLTLSIQRFPGRPGSPVELRLEPTSGKLSDISLTWFSLHLSSLSLIVCVMLGPLSICLSTDRHYRHLKHRQLALCGRDQVKTLSFRLTKLLASDTHQSSQRWWWWWWWTMKIFEVRDGRLQHRNRQHCLSVEGRPPANVFLSCDFDLDQIILISEIDLKILKMYMLPKNERFMSKRLKVEATQTDRQTDTHRDICDRTHYHNACAGNQWTRLYLH